MFISCTECVLYLVLNRVIKILLHFDSVSKVGRLGSRYVLWNACICYGECCIATVLAPMYCHLVSDLNMRLQSFAHVFANLKILTQRFALNDKRRSWGGGEGAESTPNFPYGSSNSLAFDREASAVVQPNKRNEMHQVRDFLACHSAGPPRPIHWPGKWRFPKRNVAPR